MKNKAIPNKLSLFALIMVTSAFCTSVRNLPTIAETGLQMIFFGIVAAVCYFIPVALVSAELATGWPEQGGIYAWVKQAFGAKWGFFASWLQWLYMTISMIAMLYFIAGSLAFVASPQLANNRVVLTVISLIVLWTFTFLNMKGLKMSSKVSTVGFLSGVLFPGLLIIGLGFVFVLIEGNTGLSKQIFQQSLFPEFKDIATLVLLIGFMRAFAGIEASSAHANKVDNPTKNYPIAIFIVVLIGLGINIIGSMSVAVVVPQEEISLVSGILQAFTVFFDRFHAAWLVPVLGVLVAIGQMGGASTWLMGPVKGLLTTAESGDLPPFFQRVNSHGVPRNLLICQAIWISLTSSLLMLTATINVAFWFSVALSMMIYVTMYFLLLLSGLCLRYKQPDTPRHYRVPFKNVGMWVVSCLGMATMVFSFFIAIFPPQQLPTENHTTYITLLIVGIIIFFTIPWIVQALKRPSWIPKTQEQKQKEESHEE